MRFAGKPAPKLCELTPELAPGMRGVRRARGNETQVCFLSNSE